MKVTRQFVERQLENLNRLAGTPCQPYLDNADGNGIVSQPGNYHLDNAYGGYKLCRMTGVDGGSTDVGNMGYLSLAVVSNHIRMFAEGYRAAKEALAPITTNV